VGESIEALRQQVEHKSEKITKLGQLHSEQWLLLLDDCGSVGSLPKFNREVESSHDERMQDYVGRFLYEISKIVEPAPAFSHIILFHGMDFLAFPTKENPYHLPIPRKTLLERGAKAPDEYLRWRCKLSSVRRNYDPSQGDLDSWLKAGMDKRGKGPVPHDRTLLS